MNGRKNAISPPQSHALLDAGDRRRLERFDSVVVSRPAPVAVWPPSLPRARWDKADLVYDPDGGWRGDAPDGWRVAFGPAVLGLQPAGGGGLGVFPEHAGAASRLETFLAGLPPGAEGRRSLNLFAHTGLLTLRLAALPGAGETVHVDASAGAVRQARENAALSGLADRQIRWLADDALAFMEREARRGRRYDLVAADPPSYGRSKKTGKAWNLRKDLPLLAERAAALLAPGGLLFLTCHSEGWTGAELVRSLREGSPRLARPPKDVFAMELKPEAGGPALPAGFGVIAGVD